MVDQKHFHAYCQTDIGRVRGRNEDTCTVSEKHGYSIVADGIGGLSSGDVASRMFSQTASEVITDNGYAPQPSVELAQACFTEANRRILQKTVSLGVKGMGCTAELLLITEKSFIIGHIGDSRTYLLHAKDDLRLLTEDHSLVHKQQKRRWFSRRKPKPEQNNMLLRAIGVAETAQADIITGELQSGMVFCQCTDGLYNMVSEEQLLPVLQYDAPLSFKTDMLINMANEAGGKDNITISLVEIL